MNSIQPQVLAPLPSAGRFLTFGLAPGAAPAVLERLGAIPIDDSLILGLGDPLLRSAGRSLDGLRPFPALSGPGGAFPSTQGALWLFLGGADPGELLHRARRLLGLLGEGLRVDEDVASFVYGGGRDLSGYEDGTENPKDARAAEVATLRSATPGLDGSTFVAAQRWIHDLGALERLTAQERDHVIGRYRETNEEIADAPASAHVKRTAQESFTPEAFMLRRSMPWGSVGEHGLEFVAFAASLDPYERVLRRMAGLEDGIADALLRFSRPVSGGYYWCPPVRDGRLDLRAIAG